MKVLSLLCHILFEASVLLLIVVALLAPLHAAFTTHLPVIQTIDATHAIVRGDVSSLKTGDTLPLYRFNYDWKTPIGTAYVDEVQENLAQIHVVPSEMRYPLDIAGVMHVGIGDIYVHIDSSLGVKKDQALAIFRDSRDVGTAHVNAISGDRVTVRIPRSVGNPEGLIVSNYSYHTEVVFFNNPAIAIVEMIMLVGTLLLYAAVYAIKRRSPFLIFGAWLKKVPFPRRLTKWLVDIIAGIPFIWFLGKMPVYVIAYALQIAIQHQLHQARDLTAVADAVLPYVWGVLAILYYGYFAWKRKSPILAFWRLISYKSAPIKEVSWKRGLIWWALHLSIVYVFASTLFAFFYADIAAAKIIGVPHTLEDFFAVSKYLIWALTVVGCLFGYGYSVVSIVWGRFIRKLDFTVTGWLTNAFCYPLLGVVIWQVVPSFTGPSPIITNGPVYIAMLFLGCILNLLYMLSIFNLGTMFDLMADKGVRTSLFYSVIRHPNYTLEACMFFATELVGLTSGIEWMAIGMVFFLYWIRSEREDNFMMHSNPAYAPYTKETPYKFIPGIY